ncbi:MAG: DUF2341 domain-containing protein [Candidatus Parvarchaeota archaeon]|nr:DUF2341 domain-containing protein [Candidatus Parvarchaeota archaeon]MCL5107149.1 DUF2341 domain-containing protein [Candidatus Parvarchaeota archaeon]
MNKKAQMITIFFSLFLILAIITIISIESANLQTNQNINSLQQAYNLPKQEYYNFLNVMAQISAINPSSATNAVFNSTIENIYDTFFQNLNITNQGVNTSSIIINNFAESIPLLITNYQNIATPNPFQQMINISVSSINNYINPPFFGQNVEFVYKNNSVIPSWLESYNSKYAIWWVKIASIPARGTIIIYMKFANKKINLFNNKTTGEAPQLSLTYAEYDDGANVFNYYNDFSGTTLNNFLTTGATGYTITVNNGLFIKGGSSNIYGVYLPATYNFTKNSVFSYYLTGFSITSPDYWIGGGIASSQSSGGTAYIADSVIGADYCYGVPTFGCGVQYGRTLIGTSSSSTTVGDALGLNSIYDLNATYLETVNPTGTALWKLPGGTNEQLEPPFYWEIGGWNDASGDELNVSYTYIRNAPPNGIMPSVQILNVPANIGYIAPLTITNHQNIATPNPFQQEVVINASRYSVMEAPNLDNVEFFYSNGTIIPSWLENGNSSSNNTIYWLKIGSIPANSSINVFIGFASTNLNLFNGQTVGEAPQLSPTYAEYDDGVNVFNFYSDFKGTSLNTNKWINGGTGTNCGGTVVSGGGPGVIINNGLSISTDSSTYWGGVVSSTGFTPPAIFETDTISLSGVASGIAEGTANNLNAGMYFFNFWASGFASGTIDDGLSNLAPPLISTGITGIAWLSSSSQVVYHNYIATQESQTAYSLPSNIYPIIGIGDCSSSSSISVQWARVRAYPPNGVMPSTSIGTIQNMYPFEYQYSVANFTNSTSISVPGTASTGKIWNGGHAYTLAMWVNLQHSYGACGYPCYDLFQTNQGCTSGLQQYKDNATGYQINLLEWNSSCGTGAAAQSSPYQYVPYGKWELITGIFEYNSQGNAWIASCVDTHCTNSTWTLNTPAVYSTPATILGSGQINGKVTDVQMYDSALTLNQVNQLYNEFIGAQPVTNSTLVAWIPLDGNAYDDSGNGNTASLSSVNFLYP